MPSADVEVTEELVRTLVTAGGYTHPLFATAAPTTPLPGQAVLLLMGGLVEQSGLLDDAVALLELGPARFHAMVRAGDRLSILVEEAGSRSTADGRLVSTYRWAVVDQAGSTVAETRAVMLRRAPEDLPEEASA